MSVDGRIRTGKAEFIALDAIFFEEERTNT
jgi:hypothetical protein